MGFFDQFLNDEQDEPKVLRPEPEVAPQPPQDPRQAIREALLAKYSQSQDTSGIDAAKESAGRTNMISGLGEALSDFASAQSVSRGGPGTDKDYYQGMRDRAKQAIQQAVEARQGKMSGVKGEMDMQNQFGVEDRAERGLDQTRARFDHDVTQAGVSNKLSQDKFDQATSQFNTTQDFNNKKLNIDAAANDESRAARLQDKETDRGLKADKKSEVDAAKLEALTVPDYGYARTEKEAVRLREDIPQTKGALALLAKVKELGTNVNALTDWGTVDKINTNLAIAVGKLRISLVGPGPMTEAERNNILKTIGDPTKLFSTESREFGKLDELIANIQASLDRETAMIIRPNSKVAGPPPPPQDPGGFPKTLRDAKGGTVSVANEQELQEAQAGGFK